MRFHKRRLVSIVIVGMALLCMLTWGIIQTDRRIRSTIRPTLPEKASWSTPVEMMEEGLIDEPVPIIEVTLNYTVEPLGFDMDRVRYISGYRTYPERESDYVLQIIDNENQILAGTKFAVQKEIEEPPPLDGEVGNRKTIQHGTVVVVLPWQEKGKRLQLINLHGDVLGGWELPPFTPEEKPATFKSVSGSEAMTWQRLQSGQAVLAPQEQQPDETETIDIVFISEDYTDRNQFENDVERFRQELLRYDPFTVRSSQFLFHQVFTNVDLGCIYDEYIKRLITCDPGSVWQEIHNAGVPYDQVIVIVNNSTYGGSGGEFAVAYNGYDGPKVGVHELGHSFGHLNDEYVIFGGGDRRGIDKNCLTNEPPDKGWEGLVLPNEYSQGCLYARWWRSSSTSIMRDIQTTFFNKVSVKILDGEMNYFTNLNPSMIDYDNDGDTDYADWYTLTKAYGTQMCNLSLVGDCAIDLSDWQAAWTLYNQ